MKVAYLEAIVKALQKIVMDLSNKISIFSRIAQQDIKIINLEIKTRNNKGMDK